MKNKTILITGASSGIGKATAEYFLERGWNVVATIRSPEKSEFTDSSNLLLLPLDVTNSESIKTAINTTIEKFGGISAVVNNAGYGIIGAFEDTNEANIRKDFDVNFFGMQNVIREVLPHFRKQKSGVIVNISSMIGRIPFPFFSTYTASKFAVEGFSLSLQFELEKFGIRVKLIEPGTIKTNFFKQSLDSVSEDKKTVYTDDYLKTLASLKKRGEDGADPEIVAKTIFKAVTDKSNRLRYVPDQTAKLLLFLNAITPMRLFRKILSRTI